MLKKIHIAIIGGDQRYISMIQSLAQHQLKIEVVGFETIAFSSAVQHRKLTELNPSNLDAIILPITGCSNTGDIVLNFPTETITFTKEVINQTKENCLIYTGVANEHLKKLLTETNRKLIEFFSRDDIAIANSIPTAEGALEIAMNQTDFTMHGSNILVAGFGRVGVTTARLFHQVGAKVTVTARNSTDFARIKEMGLTPLHHNDLAHTNHIDIYINTVPAKLFTEPIIQNMKPSAIIIDLASIPGGIDFTAAETHNIRAIHALALPGKVAPKTAGEIIADTLMNSLIEESPSN